MSDIIALVDDDRNILTSVSMSLEAEGFAVRSYTDGESALREIRRNPVALALLDIKMPRMDGLELMTALRRVDDLPIILLTSKDDELDEALGLGLGADDYITKPFSQRLLLARIRALLRRRHGLEGGDGSANGPTRLSCGVLVMDMDQHRCTWKDLPVRLTVTEFLLLKALAERPGHVKSRERLMDTAYGEHVYVDDRTIDSHIKRIRRKFKEVDSDFDRIETLYGVGYRYNN